MRPSWLPKERVCRCGCGENIGGNYRRRFYHKNICRRRWKAKLISRGVLPIKYNNCKICGSSIIIYHENDSKILCGKPECAEISEKERLTTAKEKQKLFFKKKKEAEREEYPEEFHIALDMRQRTIELCEREGIRL